MLRVWSCSPPKFPFRNEAVFWGKLAKSQHQLFENIGDNYFCLRHAPFLASGQKRGMEILTLPDDRWNIPQIFTDEGWISKFTHINIHACMALLFLASQGANTWSHRMPWFYAHNYLQFFKISLIWNIIVLLLHCDLLNNLKRDGYGIRYHAIYIMYSSQSYSDETAHSVKLALLMTKL